MYAKCTVLRMQTGKLMLRRAKKNLIIREVAFHLDFMMCAFRDKQFDEDCVFNANEKHFTVILDDGPTLAMNGDTAVKYSDVMSGDMGMT